MHTPKPTPSGRHRRGYRITTPLSLVQTHSNAELGYAARAAARRAEADPTIEPGSVVEVTEADFTSATTS